MTNHLFSMTIKHHDMTYIESFSSLVRLFIINNIHIAFINRKRND